jgi:hypothetical protein
MHGLLLPRGFRIPPTPVLVRAFPALLPCCSLVAATLQINRGAIESGLQFDIEREKRAIICNPVLDISFRSRLGPHLTSHERPRLKRASRNRLPRVDFDTRPLLKLITHNKLSCHVLCQDDALFFCFLMLYGSGFLGGKQMDGLRSEQ